MTEQKPLPQGVNEEVPDRDRIIVRTSMVGIAANILLAAFKAVVGILSHSIAITLDAVNNLSDALSSVITIFGSKLAGRRPDKEHPMGHGRTEYLSALTVAVIVLYAGITSAAESVRKIISPVRPQYSNISLMIIAVAVAVKIILGRYFVRKGKEAGSGALEASGADALFDAVLSFSVLVCAILFQVTGISLEAYVGAIISVFIIRSGIEMLRKTTDDIIGKRANPDLVRKIKKLIMQEEEVRGAYDMIINNYGPEADYASVHVELPDTSIHIIPAITKLPGSAMLSWRRSCGMSGPCRSMLSMPIRKTTPCGLTLYSALTSTRRRAVRSSARRLSDCIRSIRFRSERMPIFPEKWLSA